MAILSRIRPLIVPVILVIIALALRWFDVWLGAAGECRVWFLDVGQGDAELVITPEGKRMLIDGGPDASVLAKLGYILPPWDRRIDAVMLSHPDADHITGLPAVLERYRVSTIYESGIEGKSGAAQALAKWPVSRVIVRTGDRFDFGGALFEILSPDDARPGSVPDAANDFSVVTRLVCQGHSILFTGDISEKREGRLADADLHADVLKLPHHGSVSSSSPAFLDDVHPSVAVIEVGEGNTFGHPHPATMERLDKRGVHVFRTDQDGDILFRAWSNGWNIAPRPLPF